MTKPYQDGDIDLNDAIAIEQSVLFGPRATYWSLDISDRDFLYGEPQSGLPIFKESVKLIGVLLIDWSHGDINTEATQGGAVKEALDRKIRVARRLLEDVGVVPKKGDVILIEREGQRVIVSDTCAGYFNVVSAKPAENLNGSSSFVAYELTVEKNSKFEPKTRLGGAI